MVDWLTVFGFISVSIMMIAYALENKSTIWILIFSLACLSSSVYALLVKSYPFAFIETIWALIALKKWINFREINKLTKEKINYDRK